MSGFACAMGVKMTHGSKQKSGINKNKAPVMQEKRCCHSDPHQSQEQVPGNSEDHSGNCCGDKMIQFDKLDKSVGKFISIINPVFLDAFVSTFYHVDGSYVLQLTPNIRYFDRSPHLPIPDIRIIIQSFQV